MRYGWASFVLFLVACGGAPAGGDAGPGANCGACPEVAPHCVNDRCVACREDTDCAAGTCDTEAGRCVTCEADTDCSDPSAPVCRDGVCGGCRIGRDCTRFEDRPTCDREEGACVGCRIDHDCPVVAPLCRDGVCAGCETTSDCERFGLDLVCHPESGRCATCTPEEDEGCFGFVCDPRELECTTAQVNSLGLCDNCEYDQQCSGDSVYCVPMEFDGRSDGNHCLADADAIGDCRSVSDSFPFRGAQSVTSVDGHSFDACWLWASTCAAWSSLGTSCTSSTECGIPAADDAYCYRHLGSGVTSCVPSCMNGQDCILGRPCDASGFCL